MKLPRIILCLAIASSLSLSTFAAQSPALDPAKRDQIKKQLATFFASAGEATPALKQTAGTEEAIRARIANMTDAELGEFQSLMTEMPDWKSAPETLAATIPPEAMKAIEQLGASMTARSPQATKMRGEAATIVTVLKALPDSKLQELGVDRNALESLEASIAQMSPTQAAVLQKSTDGTSWDQRSAAAMAAMPPALRKGAWALAEHGVLTKEDISELDTFRGEIVSLLERVDKLPAEQRKDLKIESIRAQAANIAVATHDIVFMIRSQITAETMKSLDESLSLLERVAALTPSDRRELESFRRELGDTFREMSRGTETESQVEEKLASLQPEHLYVLKQGMRDFDQWRVTTPALIRTMSDPAVAERIAAMQQASPDPVAVASLESFRRDALAYIDNAVTEGVDSQLVQRARQVVESAPLAKLEFIREYSKSLPASTSAAGRLQAVSNIDLNCVVSLGSIDIGIDTISLGSINFNWICDPIENAINGVASAITAAVNAATNAINDTINTVKSALQSAIDAVTNTINTLVAGIISTVTDIWNFVKTIPGLAWDAIKYALNLLLDIPFGGTTLRVLLTGGVQNAVPAIMNALNIGATFWTSLNGVLPQLPCPPDGFATPFGSVGSGEAVVKYNRYKFFIDKIIDMIPDTETSLAIKIPAQILYAAFDYIGVCLQDAADAADSAEATLRYNTTISTSNSNTTLLSQQLTISFNALTNLSTTQGANITTLITTNTNILQNLINTKTTELRNLVTTVTDSARDLELRLQIEANLQANQNAALAVFQLPKANGGYLELARDIVNSAISSMLASGQSVGNASKYYNTAQADITSGKWKDAYRNLQYAYKELTK